MSDLGPLCAQKRTWIELYEMLAEAVRNMQRAKPPAAAKGGQPHTGVQEPSAGRPSTEAPPSRSSDTSGLGTQSAPGPFLCCVAMATRKSRQGVPGRLAVALRLRGGVLRRALSNVAVPALP
jgi:hypothetical protein